MRRDKKNEVGVSRCENVDKAEKGAVQSRSANSRERNRLCVLSLAGLCDAAFRGDWHT